MTDVPRLLKSRQWHSRVFAAVLVLLLIFSEPLLGPDNWLRAWMGWKGYFLVIIGALGRAYCSVYIGGRKNDAVVRDGPFSVVRNPLYVFSFIAVLGIGMQSGMFLIALGLPAAFILYYPLVVEKEEAFLLHKFGEPYATYMKEVPRWIPNIRLWREPERIEVMPKFVRRTLLDASVFFLPWPCFALLSVLHAHGTIPVWLSLP